MGSGFSGFEFGVMKPPAAAAAAAAVRSARRTMDIEFWYTKKAFLTQAQETPLEVCAELDADFLPLQVISARR